VQHDGDGECRLVACPQAVIPEGEFPGESAVASSSVLRLRRLTLFGRARGPLFRPLMHGRHEPAAGTGFFPELFNRAHYLLKPFG
jgi:hypothetical protein